MIFDIGLSELVLIAAVSLIILGPKRLPVVARTLGTIVAKFQHSLTTLKNEITHESNIIAEVADLHRDANENSMKLESKNSVFKCPEIPQFPGKLKTPDDITSREIEH